MLILTIGVLISIVLAVLGVLINRHKRYNLIPGYNRADETVKKQYDIQGLAEHIGNGLITLAVLLLISLVFRFLGLNTWFSVFIGIFIFIALVIIIGSPKFMPSPSDAKHPFLYRLLPAKLYKSIKEGTKQWLQVCKRCGHKQDFWDAGGVRSGGFGEPLKLQFCEKCQKLRMHKIRKKTKSESNEL